MSTFCISAIPRWLGLEVDVSNMYRYKVVNVNIKSRLLRRRKSTACQEKMFRFDDARSQRIVIWILTIALCVLLIAAALFGWTHF